MLKELIDNKKGITLIALVITIIVILILAGVAISTLMGENGLINRTISAKEKTEQAGVQEELQIAINALAVDYYSSGAQGTLGEYILNNLAELKKALGNEDVQIDADAKTITYKGNSFIISDDGTVKIKDGINLNKTSLTLQIIDEKHSTETLTATLVNISGTITWTSSNTSVATVENGKITTVGAGKTIITATCSGKTSTCEVTVKSVVSIESIALSPKEGTVDEGSTLQVTATLNSGATEDVVWTSSDESIATVAPSKTDSKIGIIKGIAPGGPVKITASNTKGEVKAEFTLTQVNEVLPQVGDYVHYNVTYTDVYHNSYTYSEDNGWRILSKKANETNSNLYDIELISTGMPAGLYYIYINIKTFKYGDETTWAETEASKRTAFTDKFYPPYSSNDDYKIYAAAGLYNNFANIKFKVKPEEGFKYNSSDSAYYNYGYYKTINGKTTGDLTGSEFKDSSLGDKVTGVREVTLADLTKTPNSSSTQFTDINGLYTLQNLAKSSKATEHGVNTYSYSAGYYWLASPNASGTDGLYCVDYGGAVNDGNNYGNTNGVRPVVSISGIQLTNNNGVWQIDKETK